MGKQEKQSFVNLKTMKVVATPEELRTIMDDSKINNSRGILENLDLSAVDFSKDLWNFDGWYIHNVAFSKLRPDTKERKTLFGLSFVGAYLRQVSFAQSNLIRCNFDTRDDGAISTYTSINNIVDTDTDLELLSYTTKSSSNNHYNIPEFKEFWNLTPFIMMPSNGIV